jgi:hypothetical protein
MLIKIHFFIAIKNCMNIKTIFLYRRQEVRKVGKESDFSYFITSCCGIFRSQCKAIQPYSAQIRVRKKNLDRFISELQCGQWEGADEN